MVKTSLRLPEEVAQALADLAEKCHNGNKTAALVEAIKRYQTAIFHEEQLGWANVRVDKKLRCAGCNNPIADGRGFVRLSTTGKLEGVAYCQSCAR